MKMIYNLDNLLTEKQVSKTTLCRECRLERTQLNRMCRNDVSRVDLDTICRICAYLKCTPNDIFRFSETD